MSGFLLDTNIPSEIIRSQPDPRVSAWVFAQDDATLHLSVVTIGELRKGLTILPESKRRLQLQEWLENDLDRKSTRLNSSHIQKSRMPSSA